MRSAGATFSIFSLVTLLLAHTSVESAQTTSSKYLERKIALAKQNGESEVHLHPPHRESSRINTLSALLYRHVPLLVNVVACRSAIHPVSQNSVITYCVLAVKSGKLTQKLPTQQAASVPTEIKSLIPGNGPYVVASLLGGTTSVNGMTVSMTPEKHVLQPGADYLIFAYFTPSGVAFIFDDDRGALEINTADGDKLNPAAPPLPPALRSLNNLQIDKAISVIKATTPTP